VLKPETWFYTPQLILRTPQGLPIQLDFVNTLTYKNSLLMGIGYRYYYAIYATLGYNITEKLRVMYSYEYSLGIQNYTKGGHEIGLTFGLLNRSTKSKVISETASQTTLDEIFEKLDKHDQQIEVLTKKVDSLDKNLTTLKSEIELLKSKQVNEEELNAAIGNYIKKNEGKTIENQTSNPSPNEQQKTNKIDKEGKYKVISPKTDSDYNSIIESENANYKIVLGVYQLTLYAKDYQKFIKRELNMDSKLIQLSGHPKNYIYVCTQKEFGTLKDALSELKSIRKEVKSHSVEVTRGEAWILQTLNQ